MASAPVATPHSLSLEIDRLSQRHCIFRQVLSRNDAVGMRGNERCERSAGVSLAPDDRAGGHRMTVQKSILLSPPEPRHGRGLSRRDACATLYADCIVPAEIGSCAPSPSGVSWRAGLLHPGGCKAGQHRPRMGHFFPSSDKNFTRSQNSARVSGSAMPSGMREPSCRRSAICEGRKWTVLPERWSSKVSSSAVSPRR